MLQAQLREDRSCIFDIADLTAHRGYEKYLPSEDNGFLNQAFSNEREIVREPRVDSAFERAYPGDSFGLQPQRHPGAGRFVGS